MTIVDKELHEITAKKNSKKNLRTSLLSLGLLILSGLSFFFGVDSFYPRHSELLSRTLIILFYGLMLLSAIVAILTLINSFSAIKTSKDSKTYVAIGISIFVLVAIAYEILQRL
jgi:CDP-diglyceride synthetase